MRIKNFFYSILLLLLGVCACTPDSNNRAYTEVEKQIVQNPEDIVFGNNTAPHTIFLYASYNCRYCRFLFSRTLPKVKENYLDKNIVKVIVKFVELSENPQSFYALQVASCIYRYGAYEKFHELLLANPAVVVTQDFHTLVDDIMSENHNIAECITQNSNYSFLKNNIKEFKNLNFTGTPTLVINKHAYKGYVSYENLEKILKKEFDL